MSMVLVAGAVYLAAQANGIAAKRPVFGGACPACPWGAMAEVVRDAMKPDGWDVQICYSCAGGPRAWGGPGNFTGAAAHDYEREWMAQCPLYTGGVVAVAGGWNMPWPEDDELDDRELVLWTFEASEPWVEVFSDGSRYSVIQRIT